MVLLPALFGPNNRVMGFRSILTAFKILDGDAGDGHIYFL
jgi:hypothetical protein